MISVKEVINIHSILIVFYKQQQNETILVVRILHQAMDCDNKME